MQTVTRRSFVTAGAASVASATAGVLHAAPYLAGQSAEYLASALQAYQQDTRRNDAGELMRSIAKRLNDADVVAVSGYFANLNIPSK